MLKNILFLLIMATTVAICTKNLDNCREKCANTTKCDVLFCYNEYNECLRRTQ